MWESIAIMSGTSALGVYFCWLAIRRDAAKHRRHMRERLKG